MVLKFCRECNNMLYPKEDRKEKRLLYACRRCNHWEPADNNCIYVNQIIHDVTEMTQVTHDVARDPTLPRTYLDVPCAKCGHREAVFFQSVTTRADEAMKLHFYCTNEECGHRWTD
eukprot:Rmarinus@m.17651